MESADATTLHPYHPIDDLIVYDDGDFELLRQDPFYIVSRLFITAARSWSQLLNYMDDDIQACSDVDVDHLSAALEQLHFNSSLLTRIKGFLAENLHVIEERGFSSWPGTPDPGLERRLVDIQTSLKKDYSFLITRCGQLASRCETGSGILVSVAQLLESQKGIDQAGQVHNLTKLAFIFIPLTFVSSIFGMNVSLFRSYPPIWTYFVIAVPLTALAWFASGMYARQSLTWSLSERLKWFRRRRNCFGDGV